MIHVIFLLITPTETGSIVSIISIAYSNISLSFGPRLPPYVTEVPRGAERGGGG